MGDFVKQAQSMYNDTLFVITGDTRSASALLRNRIRALCRLYRVFFMVPVCSKHGLMISLLVTTCSWQEHWQKLLDLLVLLMLHCNRVCLLSKDLPLIIDFLLQMAKFIRRVLILNKKIIDYINSMCGVGAWRVLKGDAVK